MQGLKLCVWVIFIFQMCIRDSRHAAKPAIQSPLRQGGRRVRRQAARPCAVPPGPVSYTHLALDYLFIIGAIKENEGGMLSYETA